MPLPGWWLLNAGDGVACDGEDNFVSTALDDGSGHGLEVVLARLAGRYAVPVLAGILCGAQDIVGDFFAILVEGYIFVQLVGLGGDFYIGDVGDGYVGVVHGVAFRCGVLPLSTLLHVYVA